MRLLRAVILAALFFSFPVSAQLIANAPANTQVVAPSKAERDAPHLKAPRKKFSRKDTGVTSEAGLNIPQWGIAIDAFYDPRLTDLIPGYHVVNIVLSNRRDGPLLLNPQLDKWVIVDNAGKKHVAHNHGDQLKGGAWSTLPAELRKKLSYPASVKPGYFVTIDVFVPSHVDLVNFREVTWKSHSLAKEFNVFTNYENNLSFGKTGEQHELPRSSTVPTYSDADYAKTREEILNPARVEKWDEQEKSAEERNTNSFDPSFDDAIIIR